MKGSIRQRSKGTWQLRYDLLDAESGRRRYVSETVRGTKKEAERALRERLAAIETGSYETKQKETVTEFMRRWMETYAATNTTLRTQYGYQGCIDRYITPAIGSVPLQNLTARHIQGMYAGMLERGLSPTTQLSSSTEY